MNNIKCLTAWASLASLSLASCETLSVNQRGNRLRLDYKPSKQQKMYRGRVATLPSRPSPTANGRGGIDGPNDRENQIPNSVPPRTRLLRQIVQDIQNQLVPIVNTLPHDQALQAIKELCPSSDESSRLATHRALLKMTNDEFMEDIKGERFGALPAKIKRQAIIYDSNVAKNECLLGLIDEVVNAITSNPFGF